MKFATTVSLTRFRDIASIHLIYSVVARIPTCPLDGGLIGLIKSKPYINCRGMNSIAINLSWLTSLSEGSNVAFHSGSTITQVNQLLTSLEFAWPWPHTLAWSCLRTFVTSSHVRLLRCLTKASSKYWLSLQRTPEIFFWSSWHQNGSRAILIDIRNLNVASSNLLPLGRTMIFLQFSWHYKQPLCTLDAPLTISASYLDSAIVDANWLIIASRKLMELIQLFSWLD